MACGAAAIVVAGAGGDDEAGTFSVELDNAFGLVKGGDLKVAGVRAGTITDLRLPAKGKHALVDFKITKAGFGSLRKDAFCESRPQSLIGEYFLDCRPGTAREELPAGATIPIEHTASTIPIDLLNNVLRRPYRERLRIILSELGAGVGARGPQLNDAIRRLSPALRETDKVLALLGDQSDTLVKLTEDADTVVGDLAGNKRDVGRWVVQARRTATTSAQRRRELAEGFAKLPGFLRELRPTMVELGKVADRQVPTLNDLDASAGQLERLFDNLAPFSRSTQLNVRSLARTAKEGRSAVRAATPTVAELDRAAAQAPELSKNLAIVLRDLDDRGRAVEPDPRSPGGKGYTGLEAFLQYFFDQAQAINVFDDNGYILKVNAFQDKCSQFQSPQSLKEQEKKTPGFTKDCGAYIGPNQPGVLQPDPTTSKRPASAARRRLGTKEDDAARPRRHRSRPRHGHRRPAGHGGRTPSGGGAGRPAAPGATPAPSSTPGGSGPLDGVLGGKAPSAPSLPGTPKVDPRTAGPLLDYLLGP